MNRPLRRTGDRWLIHIKITDFLTLFCVLCSGVFIEDDFARREQGPPISVKKESEISKVLSSSLTGQRSPVTMGGHATGPETQRMTGKPTESSVMLPASIRVGQIRETRTDHSWRPISGHPVSSSGKRHSWQAISGHPVASSQRGHSSGPVKGHPVSSTRGRHSWGPVRGRWQAVTGHPVAASRRGHSWRSVTRHPVSSTGRGHSWRQVTAHTIASIRRKLSQKPVAEIPSPQLNVIEPVNRSWKTGRKGAITCELCAYTTERKEKYVEHLRCHITQRYICKICGRACLKVNIFVIISSLIAIFFFYTFQVHDHQYTRRRIPEKTQRIANRQKKQQDLMSRNPSPWKQQKRTRLIQKTKSSWKL